MPDISIVLNRPRQELLQGEFLKVLLGKNFKPAAISGATDASGEYYSHVDENLQQLGLWREPTTGTIQLLPNVYREEWWDSSTYESERLKSTDYTLPSNAFGTMFLVPGAIHEIQYTKHPSSGGLMSDLPYLSNFVYHGSTGGPPVSLIGQKAFDEGFKYVAVTKNNFGINEGIYFEFVSYGLFAHRDESLFALYFSSDLCLVYSTGGWATLWKNINGTPSGWRKKLVMRYQEGVEFKMVSIGLLILPTTQKYIAFHFGRAMNYGKAHGATVNIDTTPDRSWRYRVSHVSTYDNTIGLYRITEPAPIVLATNIKRQYAFLIGRVRYKSGTFSAELGPFNIGYIRDQKEPEYTYLGTANRGTITFTSLDGYGNAWNKANDVLLMPRITLTAGLGIDGFSSERMYSPELQGVEIRIPPYIATVNRSPLIDISDDVRSAELIIASEGPSELRLDLAESEENFSRNVSGNTIKLTETPQWPITCDIYDSVLNKTYRVFDGWVETNDSDMGIPGPSISFKCQDMWMYLYELMPEETETFDNKALYDANDSANNYGIIPRLLMSAGFPLSEIVIDSDVSGIKFPPKRDPESPSNRGDGNQSIGDILDSIFEIFSDLRMVRTWADPSWSSVDGSRKPGSNPYTEQDSVWHVFRDREYTTGDVVVRGTASGATPIKARFYLVFPYSHANLKIYPDVTRWTPINNVYNYLLAQDFVKSPIPPEYNVAQVFAGTSTGTTGEAEYAYVENKASINNPTSPDYIGRLKPAVLMPELTGISSLEQAMILAREIERLAMHTIQIATMRAEWRPSIRVYDFVEVYGRDYGSPQKLIKYGVYRIEEISVELQSRIGENIGWMADYTLKRVSDGTQFVPIEIGTHSGPVGIE